MNEKFKVGRDHCNLPIVVPETHGTLRPDGALYLPVPICRMGQGRNRSQEQAEEYARRIVACLNACAGLETNHLEKLAAMQGLKTLAVIEESTP